MSRPLATLTHLSSLYLGRNQIQDISMLTKVTHIMTLELRENQIADLTPLTKQTDLNLLLLEKNKIADLTPLVNWAKADAEGPRRFAPFLRLYLTGNPLSEAAKTKQTRRAQGIWRENREVTPSAVSRSGQFPAWECFDNCHQAIRAHSHHDQASRRQPPFEIPLLEEHATADDRQQQRQSLDAHDGRAHP